MTSTRQLLLSETLSSELELSSFMQLLRPFLQSPALLLLSGHLGAGKTTWVHSWGQAWGLKMIQSPTYAFHQRYENEIICIEHFDLYRVQSSEDLESIGFWDLIQAPESLVIIEWHEKIGDESWLEFERKRRPVFFLRIERNEDEKRSYFLEKLV